MAHFDRVKQFINSAMENEGRVLIHCRAGISRSATLLIAYLIDKSAEFRGEHATDLKAVLKAVVTERPIVLPNPGFRGQLRKFEADRLGVSSFSDDAEMLTFISEHSKLWSGEHSVESIHDRIPIRTGAIDIQSVWSTAFEAPSSEATAARRPEKKAFLKRGAGTSAAALKGKRGVSVATKAPQSGDHVEINSSSELNATNIII